MKKNILTKEVFGWAMFDFANSSYTTIIITTMFGRYFINTVVGDNISNRGENLWGITLSISYLIVALVSPIIGTMADFASQKKKFLFITYIGCILFTALLYLVSNGDILIAIIFFILSNICFSLGENLISSFLPYIASHDKIGRVSGFGWGFGYIGGILALLVSIIIVKFFGDNVYSIRLTFLFTAIFFGLSAIPTFMWLKEDKKTIRHIHITSYFRIGYGRILNTFRNIMAFKELVKLLISYFFYYAGLITVISFSSNYAQKTFNFSNEELILLIIMINISSAFGAFVFGIIEDKITGKNTLIIALFMWVIVIGGIYLAQTKLIFWILACIAGIGIGNTQSATRAMVGLFSPLSKSSEFYGFWGFFGKLSSVLGIYLFGFLSYITNSQQLALLSTLCFFLLGLILTLWINEEKGVKHAVEYEVNKN